jgi:phenylpyruvate tautomerase PptA (4-oxalocrotonate tautomerase family)
MPFWKIDHPASAFTAEDKHALSRRITELYRALPKFYFIVVFLEVAPEAFYMVASRRTILFASECTI